MKYLLFIFIITNFLYSDNLNQISIQLKWKNQFQFAGFYMAKELGYYKEVGLDLQIKEFEKNINIQNEILTNKSNFGIDDSSLIYHKLNGADVIALFPVFQSSPITLITQKEFTTLDSLENRYIEFSINELENISIKAILASHEIKVHQTSHSFDVDKFISKKSDGMVGYISNQQFYLDEKNIKYNVFNPREFGFDFYGDMVFTSNEFAKNNPKIVSDFMNASKKGWEYAFSHIPETIDLIIQKYNTQNKSKESLLYEANSLKELSGYGKNFGEFKEERMTEIKNLIALLFPQKYKDLSLDNFIWDEKKELKNYYLANYLKNNNTVNVCLLDNLFPIDGVDNGKLTGISGDILNKIAIEYNLILKPVQSKNIENHFENVLNGKCDIVTIVVENSNKQYKVINRSNYYLESNLVIVTKIDKPFMEDNHFLEDKKLLTKYTVFEKYLLDLYPNIDVTVDNSVESAMKKLNNGEIDGYIVDNITIDRIIQKYGYGKFKISGVLGREKPIRGSFGVINTKPELLNIINLGINNIDKNEIEQIKEKWKVTKYNTIVDNSLIWRVVTIFIIILIFILAFVIILKRHNQDLNEWLNSTIEGIGIFKDGKLIKANKQFLSIFEYENFDEIYEKTHFSFVQENHHSKLKEKLVTTQEPYEITLVKKDGTTFDALVKGHQIEGTNLRISTIIDISELKNTQRKLKKLNITLEQKVQEEIEKNEKHQTIMFQQSKLAEMGLILNMIAHQWRQPLNNVSLVVNTMIIKYKKGHLTNEIFDKLKTDFQKQITYLSNTIDDFQDFFKPKKEKESFKIRDLINTTYSLIKPIFDKYKIEFDINIDSEMSYFGYKNELAQVILNILTNSKDAFIEKDIKNKFIKISSSLNDEYLIIIIEDNAKGVNELFLEKIFEPYFSTKSSKVGTGIGLYMSKIIITEHFKGEITANNKNDGLQIIIKLPININNL
ncbi:BvgS-like domain-containing two-component system sensor histidine kinase (NMT1, PAS domains) [Arcobacter venerupis]|uniref:histidine kinase n=1 Tax=Arcobacter venerupis TaxID=1054033 RepID=A0AAE7B9L1_9BACT|nr:ABC transporter substrate-binding protein [Arcobacter venerupis]QKF67859.1 BvgS-like domain-containing two-component system sensor histidine kinase (NMT1, PAS domains) [Arcobacter venerupis]RWS49464.1 histidine kinase [Arcobacter venerupis]